MGRRVSVRRVLDHGPDGRSRFGDVVGDLVSLGAQTAVVDTRHGLIEVPLESVSIARLVPPSTADELALETVAAQGLRPAETEELGGWLLRADHGFTRRANSVLPLRQPGRPLDEALALAHAWYAERGLPLRLQVPVEGRRLLDAELGERGWAATARTHLFVARLDALSAPSAGAGPPVEIADRPDADWLSLYRDGGGQSETGRALLSRHDRLAFATARVEGRPVAVARGAVDDGWLGVMAVEVEPDHRRRGLAGAVMAALWRWAATTHGATHSYLSVLVDNTSAVALYDRLGYWVHHDYHYRDEPAAEAP
ncbi:MAG: N-acetylglutamate synthase [Pseudonocardiales bacterium]|nr:N-acetylglutamate synthase [Pseudonocardiales bacterium]